jgi:hypothetical protein
MTSRILAQLKEYKSKKIVESMIASKEPKHRLGGSPIGSAGHAPDERKEEREEIFVYAGHDEERQDKKLVFLSLYSKKFNYCLGSAGRTPTKKKLSTTLSKDQHRTLLFVNSIPSGGICE